MGLSDFFSDHQQSYQNQVQGPPHEAKFSHELLGGAAAFEAARLYEKHRAANGHIDSHAKRNEIIAGFAGAFIDREVETKGMDYIDRRRAQDYAVNQVHQQGQLQGQW